MPKAKNPSKPKKHLDKFFDLIVANSIDFFNASIKDFRKRPKYSVINFCSGLELTLKARLLIEHWSLIVKRPEEADLLRFQNGDFLSVTVEESVRRLASVGGEKFSRDEIKCFERLRDHRNKVVHFCHDAYSKKPDPKLLEEVAAEQCTAWCYLYRRFVGGWSEHFKKHRNKVEALNRKLHGQRVFLRAKFATLKPDIDKEIASGIEYRTCAACGFRSARSGEVCAPVHRIECHVCGTHDTFLRIACPKCHQSTDIEDIVSATCENDDCEADIALSDVMEEYVPSYDSRDEEEQSFYCASCEHPEESATIVGGRYFCFCCKQWFASVERCEYCGEQLVGFDPAGSGFSGCFMCEDAAREHFFGKD